MNRIQTLFLTVDNCGLIQATVTIARIILAGHSEYGNLQKKKYLWKSSLSLNFFDCGGDENDDHKENDSEKYSKLPRSLSVCYKKKPLEEMDTTCSRRQMIFLLKLDLKLLFLCLFMTVQ